jgi:DNA-directed RNA polymerase specialized sigma subunit
MYLLEGRNVEEIAERLNVSRARISQVMLSISGKLLEKMNEDDNGSNSGS